MEGFKQKTPKQLDNQAELVSRKLGGEIVPQSLVEDIKGMSLAEIKEKFPVRYEMYLKILRASKGSEEIFEEDRVKMSDWLGTLNNLDKYIVKHKTKEETTLRDRQFTVFEDLRSFLEKGGKEGYVKLPTGAGKTVIFVEFIEALGLKTLIVVPKRLLVDQTEDKLLEFAEDLNVGKIYSYTKRAGGDVTIITYQSLVRRIKDGSLNPAEYPCLILDEVHESFSQLRSEALKRFASSVKVGFSATPTENVRGTEIHSLGVKEAAEEGVISPFSTILVETSVNMDSVKVSSNGEYDQGDLERAVNVQSRNQAAVDVYKKMFVGKLAIAYCSGIDHAKDVAKMFTSNGVPAAVMSGKTTKTERRKLIRQFKQGEIAVLCNADILIAGFDEKRASVCLNLRPTLSPVVAEQRGGRVLRLNPEDGKKHAVIVDFIDSSSSKIEPVTFTEIAGASVVTKRTKDRTPADVDPEETEEKRFKTKIDIEGLKIITNPQEVMRVVNNRIENRAKSLVEEVPEGWVNLFQLEQNTSRGRGTIEKIVEKCRIDHPEWFGMYRNKMGRELQYYSPELARIVENELAHLSRAPEHEGWVVANSLAESSGKALLTLLKIVEPFRKEHPEWFRSFLTKHNQPAEHFSPELVEAIQGNLSANRPSPDFPELWVSMEQATRSVEEGKIKDSVGLHKRMEKYRAKHPEWFGNYHGKRGIKMEFYAPELIEALKRELSAVERAPEDWMTVSYFAKNIVKRTYEFVKKEAEKYRAEHPEWFGRFPHRETGQQSDYYSPELMKILENELKK